MSTIKWKQDWLYFHDLQFVKIKHLDAENLGGKNLDTRQFLTYK